MEAIKNMVVKQFVTVMVSGMMAALVTVGAVLNDHDKQLSVRSEWMSGVNEALRENTESSKQILSYMSEQNVNNQMLLGLINKISDDGARRDRDIERLRSKHEN